MGLWDKCLIFKRMDIEFNFPKAIIKNLFSPVVCSLLMNQMIHSGFIQFELLKFRFGTSPCSFISCRDRVQDFPPSLPLESV